MQDVLAETMTLFPGPWIHVGGDEAVKDQWKANAQIQARIKELGLKDEHELQSWFIRQMDTYLTSHGRRLVGWDEILRGRPRAERDGHELARPRRRAGRSARRTRRRADADMRGPISTRISRATRRTSRSPSAASCRSTRSTPGSRCPAALEPEFQKHILGVQGQLWSEYLQTPKQVEYAAYPRLSALAEVGWTPTAQRALDDFMARMAIHLQRLKILDVNLRPL